MRAIAFLCLLHAVFHETVGNHSPYSWNSVRDVDPVEGNDDPQVCVADQSGCGCCLMQTRLERMKKSLHQTVEGMSKFLNKSKTLIHNMKESRSAFSVALNSDTSLTCLGPFASNNFIAYKHVFLNLGDSYNANNGIFTAPRSGVYSIAATIYSTNSTGQTKDACASLQVNNVVTHLGEKYNEDPEDSNTVVIAVKLVAGDFVAVKLHQDCIICDDENHYNTFTGFLVYATDDM